MFSLFLDILELQQTRGEASQSASQSAGVGGRMLCCRGQCVGGLMGGWVRGGPARGGGATGRVQ